MSHFYTDEKNSQIVISLLKAYGIKDIVVSPGGTNDQFVLSVQGDDDFKLYSAVDERHAAYLACGITQETGRPVVINCTGATASRNYMSGLTEAFYRKLPIVALTCSQTSSHIGNLYPQMTNRTQLPADVVVLSVQCPIPQNRVEERECERKVNEALLALTRHGGGPVHINLETSFCGTYSCAELPEVRKINRHFVQTKSCWPRLHDGEKIVVWVGAHNVFSSDEIAAINSFVERTGAVVFTDRTSNCFCGNVVAQSLLLWQSGFSLSQELKPDLIIHIANLPLISSLSVGCSADVLVDTRTGCLVEDYHDSKQWEAVFERMLSLREQWGRFGEQARLMSAELDVKGVAEAFVRRVAEIKVAERN